MKKFFILIFLVFISLLSINKANSDETKKYVDEIIDDLIVYRSYIDDFKYLTEKEKLFAYYMTNASIAGRDIFFDQMHEYATDIRNILSEILLHSKGVEQEIVKNIKHYLYLIWNFGCNYNLGTDFSKIIPRFSSSELHTAAGIAVKNGATIDIESLNNYEDIIFNKDFEPYLVVNNNVEESAVNFYIGDITTNEVLDYYNNYNKPVHRDSEGNILGEIGLNTKLVKGYAGLFRTRKILREQYPHELYPYKINKVIYYINKALGYATENQKGYLSHLINYLKTGDVYYWHLFNKEWLSDNPVVDFMLGFVEVYQDPLNRKGSFEAIVNYIDREETERQRIIAENVQYYEDNAPWNEAYKKQWKEVPVAKSIDIVVETGDAQTCCISGINLPNESYLRDNYGSKVVQIVNTSDAINKGYEEAFGSHVLEEFALPNEIDDALQYDNEAYKVLVYFHEITGHGGGKMAPDKENINPSDAIGGYYNTLEEARADLTALWNMLDPKTAEMGILSKEAAAAGYRDFVRSTLVMLKDFPNATRIQEAHRAAENMIVRYLMDNTEAVSQEIIDGKTYFVVKDINGMRQGVSKLLAEVQRIKSEADADAAKNLIETYGQYLDTELRDEVVERHNKVQEIYGIPNYRVMLHSRLYLDKDGKVRVDNTESFMEQQLRYDRFNKVED